jgi:predicted enzyme related to lactoylglutathione lyase
MTQAGPFIWHELVTTDQPTSGAFFSQLLGWTTRSVDAGPFGTYTLFQQDGRDVAGMMNPTSAMPHREPYWHSYIAVDDVDGCAARAVSLGGRVLVDPHEVPQFGRVCVVADPSGAIVHLVCPLDNVENTGERSASV